jgi:hypothetical protein
VWVARRTLPGLDLFAVAGASSPQFRRLALAALPRLAWVEVVQ